MGWFTRSSRAPRPNAVTMAKTRRVGSVAAREQVRRANNKSGASGAMLANYNRSAANVHKGRNNAASRASAALKRIKNAIERRKSNNKNSYKNAQNAIEDELDARAQEDLNEKVKEMHDKFDAATKKVVDEYIDDIEAEALELSKDKDPNLAEKLQNALLKIIASGDMSVPSDPKVKKILVFVLPLFLLAAPYISKVYPKFKYNPGDIAYDRIREFVDATKGGKHAGGASNNNNNRNRTSGSTLLSMQFFSSWSLMTFGFSETSIESPITLFILMIVAFYFALIISISIGLFVFDALGMIKRAIFDDVKEAQATGKASPDLQRAAPQLSRVVENPLHHR